MKIKLSIRLKAALLVIVFGLNTVIGFACAMGVNFDAAPKIAAVKVSKVHVHANGKKHHHKAPEKKQEQQKEQSKKDDCCTDKVIKIQSADKNLSQSFKYFFNAPVIALTENSLFNYTSLSHSTVAPVKYVVRNFHPPPGNILIAIQRFQI